jgi:hypothetical protein
MLYALFYAVLNKVDSTGLYFYVVSHTNTNMSKKIVNHNTVFY